ncbi:MAG: histidine--tRNA ligase [Lachnospiraceae bacterium]|nr:histidine--tRNA ligase [Lachnospiraceae bacterium]
MKKFNKQPVKGMPDYLPQDVILREHVLSMIKETYETYGFYQIETPVMERIENITGKQGGENEKLIFWIMKRGAELARAIEKGTHEYADAGMRFDLTLPLSRYYANNCNVLPSPFKALQIGNVWRADQPQKGRFRQFTQCDIDILGDNSILAEIELIAATSAMLTKIFAEVGISKFKVHVNDRRILKAMAQYAGFPEEDYDKIFIILDKFDKIGIDGIKEELEKDEYSSEMIEKYTGILDQLEENMNCISFGEFLKESQCIEEEVLTNLDTILTCVRKMVAADVDIVFDPTLVRGMSYYTGTIFEISIDGYPFSIAGGGRYDEMIGKFSGNNVPACGFSIGFERIITILKDKYEELGQKPGRNKKCIAFLIEKGCEPEKMVEVLGEATELRKENCIVTVQPLKKNAKRQKETLAADGYEDIRVVYRDK